MYQLGSNTRSVVETPRSDYDSCTEDVVMDCKALGQNMGAVTAQAVHLALLEVKSILRVRRSMSLCSSLRIRNALLLLALCRNTWKPPTYTSSAFFPMSLIHCYLVGIIRSWVNLPHKVQMIFGEGGFDNIQYDADCLPVSLHVRCKQSLVERVTASRK